MKNEQVLVIMDLQDGFIGDRAKLPICNENRDSFLTRCVDLINYWTQRGGNLIYVLTIYGKWSPLNIFTNSAVKIGTPGTELVNGIYKEDSPVFVKNTTNVFSNTAFDAHLVEQQYRELFICGVFIEYCVSKAAYVALQKGYKVSVVSDLVGYRNLNKCEKIMGQMKKAGIGLLGREQCMNL